MKSSKMARNRSCNNNNTSICLIPTNINNNSYNNFNQTLPATFNYEQDHHHQQANFSFGFSAASAGEGDEQANNTSRLTQQFEIICKIGSGYFADVYKVKSSLDQQYYAIKKTSIPFTSNSDRLRKLQEVKNHKSVPPHPNCVKYIDSWEEDGYLYIQTELCKISLNEILESAEDHKLPEPLVWSYLIDLLMAVKHLHENQLLHLDIKPDNIFISFDGVAKLGDFGLMCNCLDLNSSMSANNNHQFDRAKSNNDNIGSNSNNIVDINFSLINDHHDMSINGVNLDDDEDSDMACEDGSKNNIFNMPNDHDDSGIINRSEESIDSIDEGDSKYLASETMQGKFTKAADIFCLGITIFEVASGLDLPQRGEVYHKLRHNEIEDLYFNGLSAELVKIIKLMMEEDYTKRPSVDDLLNLDSIQSKRLLKSHPLSQAKNSDQLETTNQNKSLVQ